MAESNAHVTIEADVDDDDLNVYSHQDLRAGPSAAKAAAKLAPPPQVSGNISSSKGPAASSSSSSGGRGASSSGNAAGHRQVIGGVALESRYTSNSSGTLDEPLSATLVCPHCLTESCISCRNLIFSKQQLRDLNNIASKVVQVLWPTKDAAPLRDWDLWGPLIFCLCLAVLLSMGASEDQSLSVFTGVFVIVTLGSVVVTVNAKLLGGKVSFFQSLCVLGYCLAPLDIAALVTRFIRLLWIRVPVCLAGFGWAAYAAVNFLGGTRLEDSRALLAVYPCCLLFFLISWITLLS